MNNTERRITVRMLEAHFNALPNLLEYIHKKASNGDFEAITALNNFKVDSMKERTCLDPAEAVFGFAAMLSALKESIAVGETRDSSIIAKMAMVFCNKNGLGTPGDRYGERLVLPTQKELKE